MTESLGYRPCVGMMVFNRSNQIFVAKRLDNPSDAWQMPQGGIDEGEAPREAAFRELSEEIGTANVEVVAETDDWLRYDLPKELIGKLWKGRFRGQEQKWFLMRFSGKDSEIDLNTHKPEFSNWKWADVSAVPSLIVPFKRDLYRELVRRFQHLVEKG